MGVARNIPIPLPTLTPRRRAAPLRRLLPRPPRAALAEAPRPPASPLAAVAPPDTSNGRPRAIQLARAARERADDMQAEARAMARAAGATAYSPEMLGDRYGSRPVKVVTRAAEVLAALGGFALKVVLDQRGGVLEQRKRARAKELRELLTRLGPTFVKIGQGLSTRPDICPPEYLQELSELQVAADL